MGAWVIPALVLTASLCLSACTHTPQPPELAQAPSAEQPSPPALVGRWDGRLSLKLGALGELPASGVTLTFDLDLQTTHGVLDLSTAMGTQIARLTWHLSLIHI